MMSRPRKIIAVAAALVLMLGPLMQANMLSASNSALEAPTCGMSACCCCSTDNAGMADDDESTRECKCRLSESDEPPDVAITAVEGQPDRIKSTFASSVLTGARMPAASTNDNLVHSSSPRAGKSPPAYIFACALLI